MQLSMSPVTTLYSNGSKPPSVGITCGFANAIMMDSVNVGTLQFLFIFPVQINTEFCPSEGI
jgi:hypothetical protein